MPPTSTTAIAELETLALLANTTLRLTSPWKNGLRAKIREGSPIIDFQYTDNALLQSGFHLTVSDDGLIRLMLRRKDRMPLCLQERFREHGLLEIAAEAVSMVVSNVEKVKYKSQLEQDLSH